MAKGMRNDSRTATRVEVASVQPYHGRNWDNERYAFEGFKSNKGFTSDRFIELLTEGEILVRKDGKPMNFIGLEIETECFGVLNERVFAEILKRTVFPLFPNDLFKMQHDGSLGYEPDYYSCDDADDMRVEMEKQSVGIECITQPMTKQFIRNHYKDFKAMFDTVFPALNISCAESGNCGMHVNISNGMFGDTVEKQTEAIRKLHYFINSNYEFCCSLFRRDHEHTGYCREMYYGNARNMDIAGGNHNSCMNYSHFDSGRIEIRLVGGQSSYTQFRNTMETVFFLVNRMKTVKWEELDNFVKVFRGCNQYVFKRIAATGCLSASSLDAIERNLKCEDLELN